MIRLIAIDLDRTLLRDDHTLEKARFQTVLDQLEQDGITVALISGHSRQNIRKFLSGLNLDNIYISSHNGNRLVHQQKILRQVMLEESAQAWLLNQLESYDQEGLFIFDDGHDLFYWALTPDQYKERLDFDYPEAMYLDFEQARKKSLFKVAYYCNEDRQAMKQLARQLGSDINLDPVVRQRDWLEIHQISGAKGKVLAMLQDHVGCGREETLCFGNKSNDISMNHHSIYSLAVANAFPEYKAASTHIIPSNEEQGVIQILEEYCRNRNWDFLTAYQKPTKRTGGHHDT